MNLNDLFTKDKSIQSITKADNIQFGEVESSAYVFVVQFTNPNWSLPADNDKIEKYKCEQITEDGEAPSYLVYYGTEIQLSDCFSNLLQLIEFNAEREKREQLYIKAVEQLKNIFQNEDLDTLSNLDLSVNKKRNSDNLFSSEKKLSEKKNNEKLR